MKISEQRFLHSVSFTKGHIDVALNRVPFPIEAARLSPENSLGPVQGAWIDDPLL